MTRTFTAVGLALLPVLALAQNPRQQYIADEIRVTIRQEPRNDAASLGAVSSGAQVTVLQVLGADSFARIRTADGRTGWITARYLSSEPAAKDLLQSARKELAEARAQIESLQRELADAHEKLKAAAPAFEIAGDNRRLRAALAEQEQATRQMQDRYDIERARRRTLVTGAALVGGGTVLGLVLPLLARGKRRRYGDF